SGASGTGKSSFVNAALMPRLEETGRWLVVSCRPGARPFDSLGAALGQPVSLRERPDALSLLLADVSRSFDTRVLLFIDQFEEAFTLAPDDALRFGDCVARAVLPDDSSRIVLTIRDDFFGKLAESSAMRSHLGAVMTLPPLSRADLQAAVLTPLSRAGYAADAPELPARIADDVSQQPACLPLLQFTCAALWQRRDVSAKRILAREYEAMGGASGALATHAQNLMMRLSAEQVRTARSILLALVHPDGTRRPRSRSELAAELPGD